MSLPLFTLFGWFEARLLIVLTLVSLIVYRWMTSRDHKHQNVPPGPKGWPILGNLPSLDFHSERVMSDWNKQYGPVCKLKIGNKEMFLLGSFEAVQEAFIKKSNVYSDRLKKSVPPFFDDFGIVFLDYTKDLKEQRRFGLSTLREFGMGRRSLEPSILEECHRVCESLQKKCDTGESFPFSSMIFDVVFSVISKLLFNKNLYGHNEEFRKLIQSMIEGTKYDVFSGLMVFFPNIKYIPPVCFGYLLSLKFSQKLMDVIREEVNEHQSTIDREEPRDFIDCFLSQMSLLKREEAKYPSGNSSESVKISTSFVEEQLVSFVRDLILAGFETTFSTLGWLFLYVGQDPRIQKNLHEEIDEVLGEESIPSMSILDQFPYTRAVVQEVLRIRPLAPIGIPHVAAKEDTIQGYHIPKGALVVSNIFGIHHNEKIWSDPDEFNPERHLDSEGKFVKSPNVIPFSIGPRQCLGQQLANMEIFLVAVEYCRRFKFKVTHEKPIDMRGINGMALRPPKYNLVVSRR